MQTNIIRLYYIKPYTYVISNTHYVFMYIIVKHTFYIVYLF